MQPEHAPPPTAGREVAPDGVAPRGAALCVTGDIESVACFDPRTLVLQHEIPTLKKNSRVISIPPEDGREEELIAVGEYSDRGVLLYSPHRIDSPIRKLLASPFKPMMGVSYVSPRLVVSGSFGAKHLVASDVNSGEKVMELKDAPEYTARATSSQRGGSNGFVFVGGGDLRGDSHADKAIRHYDLGRSERTNEVVKKFKGHKGWAYGLGCSTEKNLFFSSAEDKTLRIWSVQDGTCLHTLQLSSLSYSLLIDPKKRSILCGVLGGIIEVWDYRQTRERVRKINHPSDKNRKPLLGISDLTQIDDETFASIGDLDCSVATWTDEGKILATAKTKGTNCGMCIVGQTQSGMDPAAQEERIGFLLSFSSVFWGVEVRARRCCVRMTHGMMHTID